MLVYRFEDAARVRPSGCAPRSSRQGRARPPATRRELPRKPSPARHSSRLCASASASAAQQVAGLAAHADVGKAGRAIRQARRAPATQLTPKPMTQAKSPPGSVAPSTRTPASLAAPQSTSLGHLSADRRGRRDSAQRLQQRNAGDEAELRRKALRARIAKQDGRMKIAARRRPWAALSPPPLRLLAGDDPEPDGIAGARAVHRLVVRGGKRVEENRPEAFRTSVADRSARARQNSDLAAAAADCTIAGPGKNEKMTTNRPMVAITAVTSGLTRSKAGARFVEVHDLDDAQVVERRRPTLVSTPMTASEIEVRVDGRDEDVPLGEEARERRNAGEREHQHRDDERHAGRWSARGRRDRRCSRRSGRRRASTGWRRRCRAS